MRELKDEELELVCGGSASGAYLPPSVVPLVASEQVIDGSRLGSLYKLNISQEMDAQIATS